MKLIKICLYQMRGVSRCLTIIALVVLNVVIFYKSTGGNWWSSRSALARPAEKYESSLKGWPQREQLPQNASVKHVDENRRKLAPSPKASPRPPSNDSRPLKEILLWTSFYADPYYGLNSYGRSGFLKRKCAVDTCTITNDKNRLGVADAVVVHARNADIKPLPKRQNNKQIFVFFLHEAPPASFWNNQTSFPNESKGSFNLTITYRYDSDIVQPGVGFPVKRQGPPSYVPRVPLKNRTRSVVWISSHCNTPGKRELYIKALAKYIDVDVYGKCGSLNCSLHDRCERQFDRKYKFYISAESAVCTDYVTEKLNRAFDMEIVPVVYGGLDYRRRTPPHSVIDVMNFTSPRQLAEYLRLVGSDERRYWEYFQWKTRYRRAGVPRFQTMCELCKKLHDPNYHKEYPDIVRWWKKDTCSNEFMDKLQAKGLV